VSAHLTPAQARALGITNTLPMVPARKRTTRKTVPRDGAVTVCHTCGQTFTTDAAETRHVGPGHYRFQWLP